MKNPSEGAGQGPHITTPHSPASHVNSPCKCALLLHFCCFSHHRSRAACTKVTKCTECQQALSFGESDDFTLRCSQYGTRAHCAMPPPPTLAPHSDCFAGCASVCVRHTCALVLPTMVAPPPLSHTDYNDSTPLPSLALFFAFGAVFALVCFITLAFVAPPVMRFCVSVCESGTNKYNCNANAVLSSQWSKEIQS